MSFQWHYKVECITCLKTGGVAVEVVSPEFMSRLRTAIHDWHQGKSPGCEGPVRVERMIDDVTRLIREQHA